MIGRVQFISRKDAVDFLLPRHYSGRVPSITVAFGWYVDGELKAVCTFGKPASPSLCRGICGDEWRSNVYELNRLCRLDDFQEPLSQFVGACLRRLRPYDWIVVSYADTAMNHNGYIYQACNFLYTGDTVARTDIYTGQGKHSRHYTEEDRRNRVRLLRSSKHRYVYFCTRKKRVKEAWRQAMRYPVLPYPKEQNVNYVLGEYIKPMLIDTETGLVFNEDGGAY